MSPHVPRRAALNTLGAAGLAAAIPTSIVRGQSSSILVNGKPVEIAIASVSAQASGTGMEVQLLSGTLLESVRTNGISRVKGFLTADKTLSLRWQSKVTEVARKALLTVESQINAQVTPTVIKYTSQFHYDIVQGNAAGLTLTLPATQALTRLVGEQIRDWRTSTEGNRQTLTIEFIKNRPKDKPFFVFSGHKAPHRPWDTHPRYAAFKDRVIPEPDNLRDDYAGRTDALRENQQTVSHIRDPG